MKLLYAILVALVGVLLAVPSAPASPACGSAPCPAPAVVTAVPAAAVVAPVAALGTVLPLYGAGYTGAGYGSDDESKELLRKITEQNERIIKALEALSVKGPGDGPAAGDGPVAPLSLAAPTVQAVLQKACASCHTGDKSKAGFQLYVDDKTAVKLSGPDRREVERRVKAGQMPPAPAKLSPADRDLVLKAVASGK